MSSAERTSIVARFAYVPTPDGPHVRFGVLWFVLACAAAAFGTIALAALFAALTGIAAMQTTAAWRPRADVGTRLLTGSAAALGPVGALFGPVGFAIGIGAGVALAVTASVRGATTLVIALRSMLLPAVAGGAVVSIARLDMGAFVILLLLISAYECGDYLMGAEAGSVFEGPFAGMAAVAVVTFATSVLTIGPFDRRAAWVFGALVAALAPLGAPLASALVPTARAAGPALRRLDAWLVTAPLWAWMLANHLDRIR